MEKLNAGVVIGMALLWLLTACCDKENSEPTGETGLSLRFDWVDTPREMPLPKGTTVLLCTDKNEPERIESGLDGYAGTKVPDTYDVVVYNRDLADVHVTGENCLDSLSFHATRATDGSLLQSGWALGVVEKGITVKQGAISKIDMKIQPYMRRMVLCDVGMDASTVASYEGRVEGLSAGIRLHDRSFLPEAGSMPVHFEHTDTGWVASFLAFGVHPDYSFLLNRTITFKDGRKGTETLDLTNQAAVSTPKRPGETHVIRIDGRMATGFSIKALSTAISGNNLLIGTATGAFISECRGGIWLEPVKVTDREGELGKNPVEMVALSGLNGLVSDKKGGCWWIGKTSSGWTVRRIPTPSAGGKLREVKGFGTSVAIDGDYAVVSAPFSVLGMTDESGNYTQFDEAGAVFIYPVTQLEQGKTECRVLLPSPLVAMTNYGHSLSLAQKNRLAIGVSENIRSYPAELVGLASDKMERIPYQVSPAFGCSFVRTSGDILLAGRSTGLSMYAVSGTVLIPVQCTLPFVSQQSDWSMDGGCLIVNGDLYRLKNDNWKFDSHLSDYLPKPENIPSGWGRCPSLSNGKAVVVSDDKVYVLTLSGI